MSEIIILILMMAVPMMLYMALKARMKKDPGWKKYVTGTIGIFIILIVITKM